MSVPWREILWGVTWGNNVAALEWWAGVSAAGFLLRHHIGRGLAAWWARHHGPHEVAQHLEALRQHEDEKTTGRPQPRGPGEPR